MNAFHLHVSLETVIFSVTVEELKKKKKIKNLSSFVSTGKQVYSRTCPCYSTNQSRTAHHFVTARKSNTFDFLVIARYSNVADMRVKRYLYDCPQLNIKLDQVVRLHNAVRTWREALPKTCCT